jgi:hypothetical protein
MKAPADAGKVVGSHGMEKPLGNAAMNWIPGITGTLLFTTTLHVTKKVIQKA